MKVLFSPQVENELVDLLKILVSEQYLGSYDSAYGYVTNLVRAIESTIHYKQRHWSAVYHPALQYVVYRKSHHTTWYVFFRQKNIHGESFYTVEHITNNHRFH